MTLPDFMISDIDFTMQSGLAATLELINTSGAGVGGAGLQIINNNNLVASSSCTTCFGGVVCPQLLINPFCQDTPYTGVFPGFVLTGPTGNLAVNDQSYIEYIGTAYLTSVVPLPCSMKTMQYANDGAAVKKPYSIYY